MRRFSLHSVLSVALLAAMAGLMGPGPARAQTERFAVYSGVVYAKSVHGPLRADIYVPRAGKGPFPAVLMIHGGGWRNGDRMQMAKLARDLAALNYVAVSIDYDLVPEHFPIALEECRQALSFLQTHAHEYNADPGRVAVLGSSAGGELAALLALNPPDTTSQPVQAAVVLNGVLDLPALGDQSVMVSDYLGGRCTQIADVCKRASPLYQVWAGAPPFFVGHGTADTIVPFTQFQSFVSALTRAKVPVTEFVAKGGPHTYWMQPQFYAQNLAALVRFFSINLRQAESKTASR